MEHNTNQGRYQQDICNECQCGILTQRVASKGTTSLNKTFHPHVFESSLLDDHEGKLGKLGSEKQAVRVLNVYPNVCEEGEGLHVLVPVHGIVRHVHVTFSNSLTLDAVEMYGLSFWIVLDDFNDGEAVNNRKVRSPKSTSCQ